MGQHIQWGSDFGAGLVADALAVKLDPVGTVTAYRFVDPATGGVQDAAAGSLKAIAVSLQAGANGDNDHMYIIAGKATITADTTLAVGDQVKVGSEARASKFTTAQTTIQTLITGEATAWTQPGAATALQIYQAADVAADRGHGITIVGSDGSGDVIMETIYLDSSDTSTVVAGSTSFTKVCAAYTSDGTALGAQNVAIEESDTTSVATFTGSTSELSADIPAQSTEAYAQEITIVGPNSDTTFVTVVGYDEDGTLSGERGQLDGSSPSTFTTTTKFRTIERIGLGEFTNAGTGSAKTNATVDTRDRIKGRVVTAATYGNDAVILLGGI